MDATSVSVVFEVYVVPYFSCAGNLHVTHSRQIALVVLLLNFSESHFQKTYIKTIKEAKLRMKASSFISFISMWGRRAIYFSLAPETSHSEYVHTISLHCIIPPELVCLFRHICNSVEGLLKSVRSSIHLPVCLHVTTRNQLNGFSLNLILGSFIKICHHIPILINIRQQ
jgi:hypothetical protein